MIDELVLWLVDGAVACFALHLLLTALLRWRVTKDAPLQANLFGQPTWTQSKRGFMPLLQAKYLWPFARAPKRLKSHSLLTRAVFWMARIFGTICALAMVLFLVAAFLLDES